MVRLTDFLINEGARRWEWPSFAYTDCVGCGNLLLSFRTSRVRVGRQSADSTYTLLLLRDCGWRRIRAHRGRCACAL